MKTLDEVIEAHEFCINSAIIGTVCEECPAFAKPDCMIREDALYYLKQLQEYYEMSRSKADLSSVESERKTGEWVYDGIRGRFPACKCSICGHYENADWALLQGVNYCPNCGARMENE